MSSSNKTSSHSVFLTHNDNEYLDEDSWLLMDSYNRQWQPPSEGLFKSCITKVCDPNHRPYRYIIVILLALVQGALTYTIELPGGLQATIIRVLQIDNTHYSVLFSAYSWADIVMSLIGTVIANKYLGLHRGFVIFMVIVLLGQLMCAIGCYMGSFWTYLAGRLIVGFGNGTAVSISCAFQMLWFRGKEIAFVMSLSRMVSRTFATLALATPQLIYDALSPFIDSPLNKLGTTQMVGTFICVIGLCSILGVIVLDKHGAKMIGRKPPKKNSNSLNLLQIFTLSVFFWILTLVMAFFYGIIFVFTANSPLYFVSKYGLELKLANIANSLSYTAIIPCTPILSLLIDILGYHLIWSYIGLWFSVLPCLLYMLSGDYYLIPFIGAFLISCAFAVFGSASWVSVGLVVQPHQVTTAYGVAMSLLSLVMALVGILGGVIIDHFGYFLLVFFFMVCIFFMANLVMGLFVSELLSDKKVLNKRGKGFSKKSK